MFKNPIYYDGRGPITLSKKHTKEFIIKPDLKKQKNFIDIENKPNYYDGSGFLKI